MSKYENYRTFTVKHISGLLSVSEETVRRWIRNGDLVTLNNGVRKEGYAIAKNDFLRFLKKHEKYRIVFYHGEDDNRFSKYKILDTTNSMYWENVPSEKRYSFPNGTRASVFEHGSKWSFVVSFLNDEEAEKLLEAILKIDLYRKGGTKNE